jgi:hypothetical protein
LSLTLSQLNTRSASQRCPWIPCLFAPLCVCPCITCSPHPYLLVFCRSQQQRSSWCCIAARCSCCC